MNEILRMLIDGEEIDDGDIEVALHDVCDEVHSSCHDGCPVYARNGGIPWNNDLSNCRCFKDGKAMLKFMRGE